MSASWTTAWADVATLMRRSLIRYQRRPDVIVFILVQPFILLLFRYVIGGAIRIPGVRLRPVPHAGGDHARHHQRLLGPRRRTHGGPGVGRRRPSARPTDRAFGLPHLARSCSTSPGTCSSSR